MHEVHDYLLGYGKAGDFGRFYPVASLVCRRGDRAVIRTPRGVELGTVLCPTMPGHAHHLPNTSVGQLLRLASSEDEATLERQQATAQNLFDDGRNSAAELGMPLELLDAEVLFDGQRAVLYHVRWAECDLRPLVSRLSKRHDVHVEMYDLSRAVEGCGKPDCGRGHGGCDSCASGGGCSTCGAHDPSELQAYFAGLREQMAAAKRTPLL
ncbi:MAG TPA: PSP1 C-terminal domain-containing protein [Gemmataceae bacterium]|nr:PSP1 C-terminal domain-containing protein [Gemmataceae bacterium]